MMKRVSCWTRWRMSQKDAQGWVICPCKYIDFFQGKNFFNGLFFEHIDERQSLFVADSS